MWSLAVSLPLFAAFTGLYDVAGWPNDPVDPEFYFGLFGSAFLGGFVCGRASTYPRFRDVQRRVGLSDPHSTWVDVMGQRDFYIIVHLRDGTVLFGYPSAFTDDPRKENKEVFLTEAARLRRRDDTDPGEWSAFPSTEGVLVDASTIAFIQLISKEDEERETKKESSTD